MNSGYPIFLLAVNHGMGTIATFLCKGVEVLTVRRFALALFVIQPLAAGIAIAVPPVDSLVERYGRAAQPPFSHDPHRQLRTDASPLLLAQGLDSAPMSDIATGSIAVVFPDIEEPYRSVFAQIIQGIKERSDGSVRIYPVRASAEPAELAALLKRNGTRAVIALGRQGVRTMSSIDLNVPVVVGGVLAVPEQEGGKFSGISLTPDPGLLFARLKSLLPGVRRVTVVYNPQQNEWLIKLARDAARVHGLELVAQEARDLATAARLYEAAFAASEGRRDAIWLPQDATTVDDATILPLVLRESWNRSVPVFSSSFVHAKRGALFALYPDNTELGGALAASAQAAINGENRKRGVQPLREVQTAVNLRTASHLGLHIGYQQQRNFDLTFPEP